MRIGIDYRPALHNREGIGRYARELVRGLLELGHDRELALFGWSVKRPTIAKAELGIAGSRARLSRLRVPSRAFVRGLRAIGRGADDLIGGVDLFHHTQPSALPVRAAVEIATVFDCIYLDPSSRFLNRDTAERMTAAVRAQVERSALVLAPSTFVAGEIERGLRVPRERIEVVWLGCDHVLRHPQSAPPRDPYVLTVSRVDPRKNHARMLRAFETIARDGLPHRWIVAGPPGWRCEEFEREVASSPARERIEWRRFVGEAELASLYGGAAAFLFASLEEGFGLPPLEAMACGAPVIASDTTSLPEVCGDGALYVDPTDVESITRELRRVLSDRDLADDLRSRGRFHASRMTWRRCAEATWKAYGRALSIAERGNP